MFAAVRENAFSPAWTKPGTLATIPAWATRLEQDGRGVRQLRIVPAKPHTAPFGPQPFAAKDWFDGPPPRPSAATSAPLAALAGGALASRFHAWHGASGRRYVCSVFQAPPTGKLGDAPGFASAVILAIGFAPDGSRRLLAIAETDAEGGLRFIDAVIPSQSWPREPWPQDTVEWHVHLLAVSPGARRALIADLTMLRT
jgi:hypothetical protein